MFREDTDRKGDAEGLASAAPLAAVHPPVAIRLEVGKPVGGADWVLEGTLGSGGMAEVLAVVKPLAGIRGAMKVPHAALVAHRGVSERFLEEARLYTSLKHPHIVSVIDCGLLEDGTPFMVMERLRGRTLRQVMCGAGADRYALRPPTAYEVTSAVCDALHRLHSHRPTPVVHRDVKPENIFIHEVEGVAGRGTVKLLDLGLADQAGRRRKVRMGTPGYMAPEQILGDDVSERTDQYALALVLYEMLSGRLPWDADLSDAEAMSEAHLHQAPIPLAQFCPWVPASVERAVATALAKDPARRLASILHFADGIRELEFLRGPREENGVSTARTAPTLASLAAYDTGREEPGWPARPLAQAEQAAAEPPDRASVAPTPPRDGASSFLPAALVEDPERPPVGSSAHALDERVSNQNNSSRSPALSSSRSNASTPRDRIGRVERFSSPRRVGVVSLGLGFGLGLGVAFAVLAARSVSGTPRAAALATGRATTEPTLRAPGPESPALPAATATATATPDREVARLFLATIPASAATDSPAPSSRAAPPPGGKSSPNADHRRALSRKAGAQTATTPAPVDDGREFFETH